MELQNNDICAKNTSFNALCILVFRRECFKYFWPDCALSTNLCGKPSSSITRARQRWLLEGKRSQSLKLWLENKNLQTEEHSVWQRISTVKKHHIFTLNKREMPSLGLHKLPHHRILVQSGPMSRLRRSGSLSRTRTGGPVQNVDQVKRIHGMYVVSKWKQSSS